MRTQSVVAAVTPSGHVTSTCGTSGPGVSSTFGCLRLPGRSNAPLPVWVSVAPAVWLVSDSSESWWSSLCDASCSAPGGGRGRNFVPRNRGWFRPSSRGTTRASLGGGGGTRRSGKSRRRARPVFRVRIPTSEGSARPAPGVEHWPSTPQRPRGRGLEPEAWRLGERSYRIRTPALVHTQDGDRAGESTGLQNTPNTPSYYRPRPEALHTSGRWAPGPGGRQTKPNQTKPNQTKPNQPPSHQGGIGGTGGPPRASRAPSQRPASVPLTAGAGFNGICNRQ